MGEMIDSGSGIIGIKTGSRTLLSLGNTRGVDIDTRIRLDNE